MENKESDIRKVISLGDIVAVVIIIIGLVIAISLQEIAFRMIGVSVSILGAVALFMSISQKMQTVVAPAKFNAPKPEQEFKVTVKKDTSATRKTVEDFSDSFGADDEIIKNNTPKDEMVDEDSGFSIKQKYKIDEDKTNTSSEISPLISNSENINSENKNADDNFKFSDDFSGMRIVKKFKIDGKNESEQTIPAKNEIVQQPELISKPNLEPIINAEVDQNQQFDDLSDIEVATKESDLFANSINVEDSILSVIDDEKTEIIEVPAEIIHQIDSIPEHKPEEYVKMKIDVQLNNLTEIDPLLGDEPRKEFEYFLSKVLMIIRSITNTRTACFVLLANNNNELIIESYATNIPDYITKKARFPLGNDILSQIIKNGKPEILTEINPSAEIDLLPYYQFRSGTVSFIGVPVFYKDAAIGVLCADSDLPDAYDSLTVGFLGHFTKLIAAFVQSYTRKFDLLQAAKTLEAIAMFNSIVTKSKNGNENLAQSIVDSVSKIFEFKNIGVVGFNSVKNIWEIKALMPNNEKLIGFKLDLTNTLIGLTINQASPQYLLGKDIKNNIRVYKDEPAFTGDGFLTVPIVSSTGVYGAIYLETNVGYNLTDFDISILEVIGEQAGNAVERLQIVELFNNSMLYDLKIGILNSNAFYNRVTEEFARWKEFNQQISFAIFTLDKYQSVDREKYPVRYEMAQNSVISKIRKHLRLYDVIGQVGNSAYGVLFVGRDANNTRILLENYRNEIANTVLKSDNIKFTITLSIGLYSPEKNDTLENMIENAQAALQKAISKANNITIFA